MPKKGSGKKEQMSPKELKFVDSFIEDGLSKEQASARTQGKKRGYAYALIAVLHGMGKDLFSCSYEDFSRVPGRLKNGQGEPITQNSRQSYLSTLKAMIAYMERAGMVIPGKKEILDIKPGSPTKQNKEVLSPEEWQAVLNAPMSAKERAYIAMLYDGYHRPTEPLVLKWSDLKINGSGAIEYRLTFKTKVPRIIVQKPDTTGHLEAWRRESGHNFGDNAYIFPANDGRMYTSRGFSEDLFKKIEKATGITLVPSSIRNTAITHDVQNELPLTYVCLRAWGEPYNPMINVYTKANSAKLQETVQAKANGQPVKIEATKPREIKTMKKCPACGKDNAVLGDFCVFCGSKMDGKQLGAMVQLDKDNAELRGQIEAMKQQQAEILKALAELLPRKDGKSIDGALPQQA